MNTFWGDVSLVTKAAWNIQLILTPLGDWKQYVLLPHAAAFKHQIAKTGV
jgi:hypothetical protein